MGMRHHYEKSTGEMTLYCEVIPMGRDYAVSLWDDTGGHIGSVCMSVARPSLTGKGISATTSVLNCPGHKEEVIAREISEAVAIQQNCTVVCSCGIHFDGITPKMIEDILAACRELKNEMLADLGCVAYEKEKEEEKTCTN